MENEKINHLCKLIIKEYEVNRKYANLAYKAKNLKEYNYFETKRLTLYRLYELALEYIEN